MFPVDLDENGQLGDKYKPAIYLDTNFLRHYFKNEGAELSFDALGLPTSPPWEDDDPQLPPTQEDMSSTIIADLVRPKEFVKDFGIIRNIAINCLSTASLIVTPIALLELFKLHAEVTFKDICADVVGVKQIQRMGDKQVGNHLSHLLRLWHKDRTNEVIKSIIQDCNFDFSFAREHGLDGIFYVENFKMTISDANLGQFLWTLSFLQLEATDILHIHSAKSLGCEFFATLDQGIASNKDSIEEACGLKVLGKTQELIDVLRQNIKTDA
ncbi:MAG: hypothetical protein HXX11_10340 [Desulfuromonadales bacterium]|nr:hypothetical protein [Desulfuromonadales bacterium]